MGGAQLWRDCGVSLTRVERCGPVDNCGLTGASQNRNIRVGKSDMKRQMAIQPMSESVSQRLAGPAMFLGSLFAIALMLYAVDATPLRALLLP
jgi:hypothetical protein